MPSDGSIPTEPSVRWILAPAFRRAVTDLWGQPGRERVIANLSGEARDEFASELMGGSRRWFPARHLIAWGFATWEGPANRTRDAMARCVRRQWDLSMGVIRRMILHLAPPAPLVARLPVFWKQDNVGGTLDATLDEGALGATIHLNDSPFVDTPHGRASVAEVYRHAFAQTRAKNVTEVHALDGPKRMVIRLKWNA